MIIVPGMMYSPSAFLISLLPFSLLSFRKIGVRLLTQILMTMIVFSLFVPFSLTILIQLMNE